MEQNTQTWLEWRKEGIGASDANVVMGVSPYATPYQLWLEKTGQAAPETKNNYIKELGHMLEVQMRAHVELATGLEFPPSLVRHKTVPWLRASLDGYNEKTKTVLECKFVGKEAFKSIQEENRPLDHHYPQVQHQLAVTGAEKVIYCFCTRIGRKMKSVSKILVMPDKDYINEMYQKEKAFWEKVKSGEWDVLSDKDPKEITDQSMIDLLTRYQETEMKIKELSKELGEIKQDIENKKNHPFMIYGDFKVKTITKKGSVDYKKIFDKVPGKELYNLDEYRRPDSSITKITY